MAAYSCNICGKGFDFGDCSCDSQPEKASRALPTVEQVAIAFVRILRETVGEEDYAKIVVLNAAELNPDVCNSGDFCDSNMVMDAALKEFGVDPAPEEDDFEMPDDVHVLWNAAWDRAKELMQQAS
ncbi:hypothetical protein [Stenotrophomonas phage DLP4]|nr:hypothetical protein [Stenotrophomonas phage DLP4]